jgi:hypothetical protein
MSDYRHRWGIMVLWDNDFITHDGIDELAELQGIVERGPDWNMIERIEITLNRWSEAATTVGVDELPFAPR